MMNYGRGMAVRAISGLRHGRVQTQAGTGVHWRTSKPDGKTTRSYILDGRRLILRTRSQSRQQQPKLWTHRQNNNTGDQRPLRNSTQDQSRHLKQRDTEPGNQVNLLQTPHEDLYARQADGPHRNVIRGFAVTLEPLFSSPVRAVRVSCNRGARGWVTKPCAWRGSNWKVQPWLLPVPGLASTTLTRRPGARDARTTVLALPW